MPMWPKALFFYSDYQNNSQNDQFFIYYFFSHVQSLISENNWLFSGVIDCRWQGRLLIFLLIISKNNRFYVDDQGLKNLIHAHSPGDN